MLLRTFCYNTTITTFYFDSFLIRFKINFKKDFINHLFKASKGMAKSRIDTYALYVTI